jgi:hypothetical protein
MSTDTIECPFCAEIIKAKAKKCRFCDEFLEEGLTQEAILAEHKERKQALEEGAQAPVATVTVQTQAPAPQEASAVIQTQVTAPPGASTVVQTQTVPLAVEKDDGETDADPLGDLYQKLAQMPDSPERDLVLQTLQELAVETQKDEAEKEKIQNMVKTVVEVLPDVAEVTINTMINPASGLMTLVRKVAGVVQKEEPAQEQAQEVPAEQPAGEPAPAPAEPVEVDAEKAVEALGEVQEQLEQMSDSPEKELVKEALQQLKADKEDESQVGELIEDVAEALPDVAEAAAQVVQQVTEKE